MVGLVNAPIETIRHELDTLNKILQNGEVSIIGLTEVNRDCRKVQLKENLYHWTDCCHK